MPKKNKYIGVAKGMRVKDLLQLIEEGCDGGCGEFEEYMPEAVAEEAADTDTSFIPVAVGKTVRWEQIAQSCLARQEKFDK